MSSHFPEVVSARIPIHGSQFRLYAFPHLANTNAQPPLALVLGDIRMGKRVLTRIHSECLTGDVFNSQRCDCGYQLDHSLHAINSNQSGLVIYLRQEGRGIGIAEKLKAYDLQDQGFDTVEANIRLGHEVDSRTYDYAAKIIKFFDISSIELLTNNPHKVRELQQHGIPVGKRIAIPVIYSAENETYLRTKQEKLEHLFME